MSKYLTGFYKGEEIMIECDKDIHWTDHGNNVFINREYDSTFTNYIDTFRVSERLRGNNNVIWATGLTFPQAQDLAERLVIGKDYTPPLRPVVVTKPRANFSIGDALPGDFHLHMINDRGLGDMYGYIDQSRFEIEEQKYREFMDKYLLVGNKVARIVYMDEENDIPAGIAIMYQYDDRFYTALLIRKDEPEKE